MVGSNEWPLVRSLDGSGATALEVGGKAASLDRLVQYGFPVPEAIALTTHAYGAFVSGAELVDFLQELRASELLPADALEAETIRVEQAFLSATVPIAVEQAIREAARGFLIHAPVAVRSSATAEDLAAASFAGQYRTFLDVKTEDEVVEAVQRCWASLWGPSVRAYRRREGVAEEDLAMGVVIQAMAPADWAGVLFTLDPEGEEDTARIEAVRGLGESLVSGQVTPHDYRIDRATLAIRGSHTHWPPTFLEDLTRLGLRIERRMGAPQDIEWAYTVGRLFVLQTRPITVQRPLRDDDDGFDTVPIPGATYTPAGVQEMLPGVVPPLLWTINAPLLDEAFRRLFSELGAPVPATQIPLLALGRFRGRAALNLSLLREAASGMPGGSRAEVERQYLGRVLSTEDEPKPSGGRLRRALAGLRALRIRKGVQDEVDVFAESVHGVIALSVALPDLPTRRLLAFRARIRDLAARGYAAEVATAAAAAAAYRALEIALGRWMGAGRAASWAQKLTTSPMPTEQAGLETTLAMWEIYAGGLRGRAPGEALEWGPCGRFEDRLRFMGGEGEELLGVVNRVVRHLGSMAIYGGPSWDEDRALLWERVRAMARCEEEGHAASPTDRIAGADAVRRSALRELQAELRRSWKWRATRVLTGQVIDVRGRLLRKLAADASRFLMLREKAKGALLVLGGEERRLIVEAARRLRASGHLSKREDVLLLADRELEELLLGGEPVSSEEIVRRRNALARAEDRDPLPETFEGLPGTEELPPITGEVLTGWAASPGRVQGLVRVLRNVADGRDLVPGEIIVARTTDPSWSPLFLVAGGIVLEEGGPLSHAAIVAREFGLPAVLNVKGATRALSTGELVEVDGSEGRVTRAREEIAA